MKALFTVCLLAGLLLSAEELEVIGGRWELSGEVRKLHDTPLGAVYRFEPGLSYDLLPARAAAGNPTKHPRSCDCRNCDVRRRSIRGSLQVRFGKRKLPEKRFVVLDFKVRTFPALNRTKTPEYQFQIIRSPGGQVHADAADLNGQLLLRSDDYFYFNTGCQLPLQHPVYQLTGFDYSPAFEPHAYRIIFDTLAGSVTVIRNQYIMSYLTAEKPVQRGRMIEVNNLGIISQTRSSDSDYRKTILEFSPPLVYRFQSSALLEKLPPLTIPTYPYSNYPAAERGKSYPPAEARKRLLNHPNPDLQYAYALELLYGEAAQPSQAIELLEKAVREDHVLAMAELGLCYARGYGVKPDREQALRYLRNAKAYGYLPAAAMHGRLLWEEAERPKFIAVQEWYSDLQKLIQLVIIPQRGKSCHDLYALANIIGGASFGTGRQEFSPKRCVPGLLRNRSPHSSAAIQEELDALIAAGYRPAWWLKGVALEGKASPEEVMVPLAAGAAAGDPDCQLNLLIYKAIAGTLTREDFTPASELALGSSPQYRLLEFAVRNPDFPGIAEFLQFTDEHRQAAEIWGKSGSAKAEFLLGLLDWSQAFPIEHPYGLVIPDNTIPLYDEFSGPTGRGFARLERAAGHGIPEALYLVARQYCHGDLPLQHSSSRKAHTLPRGKTMMREAAAKGQLSAQFAHLELAAEEPKANFANLLADNERFVALNHLPAWLLKAKLLNQLKQPQEAGRVWQEAAERGLPDGWRLLAERAYAEHRETAADAYWVKYIRADQEQRRQDRFDFYYPRRFIELEDRNRVLAPARQGKASRSVRIKEKPDY